MIDSATISINNENCIDAMYSGRMDDSVNVILTSPFYNTNKKAGHNGTIGNTGKKEENYEYVRYDMHTDDLTNEEYDEFTVKLFEGFDRVLKENGVVLYNINYGTENTTGMFTAINAVITRTNFTIADVIVWKKSNALPNNTSTNKLTRIWEFVFVLCRKSEFHTFNCNKQKTSKRKTGQTMYENIFNFVEAKNNDGTCPYNKATYSTDLCKQLLKIYARDGDTVYDPFMGSGTTAVACCEMGLKCIGSELSEKQTKWAMDRVEKTQTIVEMGKRQKSFFEEV